VALHFKSIGKAFDKKAPKGAFLFSE
jgi:hypothetical protein